MGRPDVADSHAFGGERPLKPWSPALGWAAVAAVAALAVLPLFVDSFTLKLMIEVIVLALFAFSLNFLMGTGGIISFGHAAYFGLGAYGAALIYQHLGAPMELAIVLAPVVAGIGAAAFGYFIVRLSGVYLAMLTLAVAQIVYAVAFQWVEVTGGDNGLIGIWPSAWAKDRLPYYYMTLVVCGAGVWFLRRVIYAPFGYTLRAGRDSALRADAIGIDLRTHRWLAFTLAGAAPVSPAGSIPSPRATSIPRCCRSPPRSMRSPWCCSAASRP